MGVKFFQEVQSIKKPLIDRLGLNGYFTGPSLAIPVLSTDDLVMLSQTNNLGTILPLQLL